MTREERKTAVHIMRLAIEDQTREGMTSNRWTAKRDGLHWSYLDSVFKLNVYEEITPGHKVVQFLDDQTGVKAYTILLTESNAFNEYLLKDDGHDFHGDLRTAIYWTARKMISKAENLY